MAENERLPLVNRRQVETSGQTPGYLNVNYDPEAFGAGIGRALVNLGQAGFQIGRTLEDKKANDALNHVNAAKDELRPWLFDPNQGAFAQQGGKAQGLGQHMTAVLDNIKNKQLEAIEDPTTKAAFEKLWTAQADSTKDRVASHELKELGTYKQETTKGVLLGAIEDAYNFYNDPSAIEESIRLTRTAIAANTLGQPPELVKAAEAQAISGIHLAVVTRMASENPQEALDYLALKRDDISGADHVTANNLIKPLLQERRADQWIAERSLPNAIESIWPALQGAESSNNPAAVSPDGAVGLGQLMESTARDQLLKMGRSDLAGLPQAEFLDLLKKDPSLNVRIGKSYLAENYKRFGGDMEAALVAYNAGPDDAEAFLKHNAGKGPGERDYNIPGREYLARETKPYVDKIMAQGGTGVKPGTRITKENWSLKNFQPSDLLGNTPGTGWVDAVAATTLDDLATQFQSEFPGVKISVNDPHDFTTAGGTAGKRRSTRTADDNPGAKSSKHLEGQAFDIQVQGWNDVQKARFIAMARSKGFGGIGFYGPGGHLHIDMGNERSWGHVPAWAKDVIKTPVNRNVQRPGAQVAGGQGGGAGAGTGPAWPTSGPTSGTAIQALFRDANEIADPTMRDDVFQKLNRLQNIEEADAKQQASQLKAAAWKATLENGFESIPPNILALLGREEVAGLKKYDEDSKKPEGINTNWERFSQLKLLSEEELLQVDPYDYRPYLADAEFKEVVNLVQSAKNSRAGDASAKALQANMRSRADILKSVAVEQGWDLKTDSGAKSFAQLDRKVDDFIALEQQAKNRALTPIEVQDIVDKLLIQNKSQGLLSRAFTWERQQALGVENPDEFTAAAELTDIAPDDQVVLQQNFEAMWRRAPNQEEAVDLYNRAMRVYLGGTPQGPDEELALMAKALQTKFNRVPSENEVRQAYGRYLLQLLGR